MVSYSACGVLLPLQVAVVLSRLTAYLCDAGLNSTLLELYGMAWPRLSISAATADTSCCVADVQCLLEGDSQHRLAAAAKHKDLFDFYQGAALVPSTLPPGLRLVCILGAHLACDDAHVGKADLGDIKADPEDTTAQEAEQLRGAYLQGFRACETLWMPQHLREAILAYLSGARGGGAVRALVGSVLRACAALLPQAPAALLPSQLGVAHVLAQNAAHRRVVVAARLRLAAAHAATSTFAEDVAIRARLGAKGELFVRLTVRGASAARPRRVMAWLGIASRREGALRALAAAAEAWCCGEAHNVTPRRGSWLARPCGMVLLRGDPGTEDSETFWAADSTGLGYSLHAGDELVAFVSCQWPENEPWPLKNETGAS